MEKQSFHIIGLLVIFGLFSGCCSWDYSKEDFEFTQEELNLMGTYQVGDTIYFESNLDDIDTITVVEVFEERHEGSRCFISRGPSNYRSIKIKHLPSDKWNYGLRFEGGEEKVAYQPLISVKKDPIKQKNYYSISFKGFDTLRDSTLGSFQKEYIVDGKIISDCYEVKHGYPERIVNPDDIEIVYWTVKYGLTAYTSKSGETWLLKNLDNVIN